MPTMSRLESPGQLQFKIIRSLEDFRALRSAWNSLLAADPEGETWQSSEWLDCWLRAFAARAEIFVATAWNRETLVSAAPLLITSMPIKGVQCRILRFIENGITPRSRFLQRQGETEAVAGLWQCLATHRKEWDLAILANVPDSGGLIKAWESALRGAGLRFVASTDRQSAYIEQKDHAQSFVSDLSPKMRHNITTSRNRLNRAGEIAVDSYLAGHDIAAAMELCFDISARSWKAAAGSDLGGKPHRRQFYEAIARDESVRSNLYAWILRLGGNPIAFELMIRSGSMLTGLATDYDQAYRKLSPGVFLRSQVLEKLSELAINRYDLAGQLYGYKLFWTKTFLQHYQYWVFHRGLKSRVLHFLKSNVFARRSRQVSDQPPDQENRDES